MSDPICRVQNPYPRNVVKLVHNLPHSEMSNDEFKEFMKNSEYGYDSFFKTYYQLACQLGLYYIDELNIFHPRFKEDINEEQAESYLIFWFSKYYVPNPYTRGFSALSNPILVEDTLYEYTKKYGNSKDVLTICKEIFKEDIGNPDIFINAINSFSQKISVTADRKFEIKDYRGTSMETTNNRDDKKAFFHSFDKTSKLSIPFPHNRIIFGAPGTGKSHMLKDNSNLFENQEPLNSDELNIIKQKVLEANESSDKLNRFIAIGFSHSEFLKDYTKKQIRDTFGVENSEDNIYVGAKAKSYYNQFTEDDEDEDTITKRINEAKEIKGDGMLQVLAGIGFRFSETLIDYTKEELKKDYPLDSRAQIYWVYRAIHGTKYIKNQEQEKVKYLERVTFHPNYSYAQFVGTYKPVQDSNNDENIKYEYVPGPFMRVFVNAVKHPDRNFLLLIEEINRANVAAVFGDVFQLLDRKADDSSEYPITVSEDIKKYLTRNGINADELSIPFNMYIWATMNSADQGVLPMDAAFKRRWDFEYINIDDGAGELNGVTIPIPNGKKEDGSVKYESIEWNELRKTINEQLKKVSGVNEDKLLGPFFIGDETKISNTAQNPEQFCKSFKSKVLMYLFEDVVKMQPGELFEAKDGSNIHYSDICKDFDSKGLKIFVKSIYNKFEAFNDGEAE